MRKTVLAAALVVACSGLVWLASRPGTAWELYDFVQYWAAGRLVLRGENPYDTGLVHQQQREADPGAAGIEMWNPPWALTLVMPFGALPPRPAHLLWVLLHLVGLMWAADAVWRHYGGSKQRRWIALLVTFTSVPTTMALTAGQIAPVLFVGAVLFLRCMRSERHLCAGASAAMVAIKPHLALLFGLALLCQAARSVRWRVVAGGLFAVGCATLIPLIFNTNVVGQYLDTLFLAPPARYDSPTLGMVLRLLFGREHFWLQFLPLAPGVLWLVAHWWKGRTDWRWADHLPLILLVSLQTAVYGAWPFDLVLCLPGVLQVAASLEQDGSKVRRRAAFALHFAMQVAAFGLLAFGIEYFWFLWMCPAYLVAYVWLSGVMSRQTAPRRRG